MTITVTQEDIDQGERQHCQFCPVARAIQREFQGNTVVVDETELFICDEYGTEVVELPQAAIQFITDFDNDLPVKPFSFPLEF